MGYSSNAKSFSDTFVLFDNLIDRKQLAQKLGVSPAFISKMMVVDGLPYIKLGRAVRYDLREVMVFLNKRKYP